MSGGAYGYLCWAAHRQALTSTDVQYMRATVAVLRSLGPVADRAVADTEAVIVIWERLLARLERLSAVWMSAEWWQSGDLSADDVIAALTRYQEVDDE
jgi:hypothetical protein